VCQKRPKYPSKTDCIPIRVKKETCIQHAALIVSKETCMCRKRPTKKTSKRVLQNKQGNFWARPSAQIFGGHGPIYLKRELYVSKETYKKDVQKSCTKDTRISSGAPKRTSSWRTRRTSPLLRPIRVVSLSIYINSQTSAHYSIDRTKSLWRGLLRIYVYISTLPSLHVPAPPSP